MKAPSPLVAMVASGCLAAVSLGLWADATRGGLGGDLERVTEASEQSWAEAPTLPESRDIPLSVPGPGGVPATPEAGADSPAPSVRADLIRRVDATEMPRRAAVDPPSRLLIPSIGVDMRVRATGVRPDGQMELPDRPSQAGWYRFGAGPGDERGSAVLGAHVDSRRWGVGPLARLAGVTPGERVTVVDGSGERHGYRIATVRRIAKEALPVDRIFRAGGPHRLVIATCGGRYLPEVGGYEDNIVVVAEPIA